MQLPKANEMHTAFVPVSQTNHMCTSVVTIQDPCTRTYSNTHCKIELFTLIPTHYKFINTHKVPKYFLK